MVDGPHEYTFGRISGLALLPDSTLVVVDASDGQARVYDFAGEFQFSFGRRGSGPGEFMLPIDPVVTQDAVLIYDMQLQRLVSFSHDGQHISTEAVLPGIARLNRLRPLRAGKWLAEDGGFDSAEILELLAGQRPADQLALHSLLLLNGATIDTITRFRSGSVFWYDAEKGFPMGPYTGRRTGRELLWNVGDDSLVVIVDAVGGRLEWLSVAADSLERIAERDLHLPVRELDLPFLDSLTQAVKQRYSGIARVAFVRPRYSPYFTSVVVDGAGRAWLRRAESDDPSADDGIHYPVVGMGSTEPFEVVLPRAFAPVVFTPGMVIGVRRNELDVEFVEAYRWSRRR